MPETFVLYACCVMKPDAEVEARRIEWLEEIEGFIETEAYSVN
jgi:hypothetical protein